MKRAAADHPTHPAAAAVVIGAGVAAALHVGKLAPAIGALQQALGLTLLQAGFLLSLVQLAGMGAGLAFGVVADRLGGRRSMLAGLLLLAVASAAGGSAPDALSLMLLRALEGFGFLLVVLPVPGLLRTLVEPQRLSAMLGVWGAYMPLATALALLAGPVWIAQWGWRSWWWGLAALSLAAALALAQAVRAPGRAAARAGPPVATAWARVRATLASPGPWLVATSFAMYSGQWLAVIGFLPTLYAEAGVAPAATGVLSALAAAVNMVGNITAGRLLQRGWRAGVLLRIGFAAMALAAIAAFAGSASDGSGGLPPALRYAAILLFSGCGGVIPATLFSLALRVAPGSDSVSSTIGWVQQWSSLGQFAGPPLVAGLAGRVGGWHWTWVVTVSCAAIGLVLSTALLRWIERHPQQR